MMILAENYSYIIICIMIITVENFSYFMTDILVCSIYEGACRFILIKIVRKKIGMAENGLNCMIYSAARYNMVVFLQMYITDIQYLSLIGVTTVLLYDKTPCAWKTFINKNKIQTTPGDSFIQDIGFDPLCSVFTCLMGNALYRGVTSMTPFTLNRVHASSNYLIWCPG